MSRHRSLITLVPGLLLLSALPASADTIAYGASNPALVVNLGITNGTKTLVSETGYAGLSSMTDTPSGGSPVGFNGFCLDVYHSFTGGAQWQASLSGTFAPDTTNPALIGTAANFGSYTITQELAYLFNTNIAAASQVGANDQAAGLQLALWAIEYSNGKLTPNTGNGSASFVNLTNGDTITLSSTGDITAFNAAVGDANAYITNMQNILASSSSSLVTSSTATFFLVDGRPPSNTNSQDFIGSDVPTFNPHSTVPEPSSFLLVTAGLGAVAVGARKARRARLDA
jgi:PEP-CTERM motif